MIRTFLTFQPKQEPWSEYTLEDGSIVRLRTIITKVHRTSKIDDKGFPVYEVQTQCTLDIDVPPHMVKAVHPTAEQVQ